MNVKTENQMGSSRSHISVQLRGQITIIPVTDIVYFMADNKYVRVRTRDERHYIEDSLVSLEQEFDDKFLRIHRNAIVSIAHIRGMEKQNTGQVARASSGTSKRPSRSAGGIRPRSGTGSGDEDSDYAAAQNRSPRNPVRWSQGSTQLQDSISAGSRSGNSHSEPGYSTTPGLRTFALSCAPCRPTS